MDKNEFPSETRCIRTSCGKFYTTVVFNHSNTKIRNIFFSAGKAGGCASAHLTSLSLFLDELINKQSGERLLAYSKFTSIQCSFPESCLKLVADYILETELRMCEKGGEA
jgi:hypothetical protein